MKYPDEIKEEQIQKEQELIINKVRITTITSLAELNDAVSFTQQIKQARKRVEEVRDFFVKPLKKQIKEIDAKFKPYITALEEAEAELKSKIVSYQTEQEKIRREQEEKLRKQQELKYKKELEKAEKKGKEAPPPPPPVKIEAPKIEGLQNRKIWDFEIVDVSKIPAEYLIPDEKKIRKVVNAGVREIPGIRIFEKTISAITNEKEEGIDDL